MPIGRPKAIWEAVAPLLPGFTVEILPQIDSTNSELMRRARAGRTDPVLLVAEQQTAGRGRLGRGWASDAGRIADFFAGPAAGAAATGPGLSLAVGVSLAESLHPRIQLKWPNDLWLADRKLAGILIETASFGEGREAPRYAVIGVGINIAARDRATGLSTAARLAARSCCRGAGRARSLLRIALPLVQAVQAFETFGFRALSGPLRRARRAARTARSSSATAPPARRTAPAKTGALLVHTAGRHEDRHQFRSQRPAGQA